MKTPEEFADDVAYGMDPRTNAADIVRRRALLALVARDAEWQSRVTRLEEALRLIATPGVMSVGDIARRALEES